MSKKASPLKELEKLPSTYDAHEWADYIELLCLASKDGRISKADALDFIRERIRDLKEGKPIEGHEAEDEEIEAEMGIENKDEDNEDIDAETIEPAIANDKWDVRGDRWFDHLEYRAGAFADFYPFEVTKSRTVLALKGLKASLSLEHKLYSFFLLASSLKYFSRSDITSIASIFEVVSFHALKTYLPSAAITHMFGKHSLNKAGRYSSGTLWKKINLLATDIKERIDCKKSHFKPTNTGDAGLDLVAWVPLEEPTNLRRGFFITFGQCACTPKWVDKQYETHYDTWRNYMKFAVYPIRLTFIPYCFRESTGDWYNETEIRATILIDRLRLINLLRDKETVIQPHIISHVNDVLENAVFDL